MAQKVSVADRQTRSAPSNLFATDLAEAGKQSVDAMIDLQRELCDAFGEINRNWFAHAQSEANLVSDLVTKLTASRSVPDVAATCQEWMGRRIERLADNNRRFVADCRKFNEDSRRFVAESQRFMEAGARYFSNSGVPKA